MLVPSARIRLNLEERILMNNQLVAVPGHRDHPPQPLPLLDGRRRVGLLDRAALHLGVALISWGRRPARAERRPRPVVSRETLEAVRELEKLRSSYLLWGSDLARLR